MEYSTRNATHTLEHKLHKPSDTHLGVEKFKLASRLAYPSAHVLNPHLENEATRAKRRSCLADVRLAEDNGAETDFIRFSVWITSRLPLITYDYMRFPKEYSGFHVFPLTTKDYLMPVLYTRLPELQPPRLKCSWSLVGAKLSLEVTHVWIWLQWLMKNRHSVLHWMKAHVT